MIHLKQYEHVGIRVTNLEKALNFYADLGFHPDPGETFPEFKVVVVVNGAGLRLNLIYNGVHQPDSRNILIDEPKKYPGITHVAFIVNQMEETVEQLNAAGITVTEGPSQINPRRSACFVRDPDGNVIELNQIFEP